MISETQEEQASLYVLGLLCREEADELEREMAADQEMSALVASLNNASVALARSLEVHQPPVEVKERLMASISKGAETNSPQQNGNLGKLKGAAQTPLAVVKKKPSPLLSVLPWLATAALAVLSFLFYREAMAANQSFAESVEHEKAVVAFIGGENENQRALLAQQQQALTAMKTQQEDLQKRFEQSISDGKDLTSKLAAAEIAKAALREQLAAAEKSSAFDREQIAVMGSLLKDKPKAVAVSVWNQENQNGLLVVENLPALAPGKDYQLWVIDPAAAAPISAGVFKVDAQGKVRLTFKPTKTVKQAGKFAITEEKEGGVESPTMNKMVVIGG